MSKASTWELRLDLNVHERWEVAAFEVWYSRDVGDLEFDRTLGAGKVVTKRRAEFNAGRQAAEHALQKLGSNSLIVGVGPNRRPLFPQGYSGSIAHTRRCAVAIVANSPNVAVGVDIENIVSDKTYKATKDIIALPEEFARASSMHFTANELFTLIFSAKETVFKMLFPYVDEFFDFSAARLTNVDSVRQVITLKLSSHLAGRWGSTTVGVRFMAHAEGMLTWSISGLEGITDGSANKVK